MKLYLKANEVYNAIIDYYSNGNNKPSASSQMYVYDEHIDINFYLTEKISEDKERKTCLTSYDLDDVLKNYLKDTNYELLSYKYSGGIRRVGYFIDENTPIFEGIELLVKEKVKKRILSR